MWLSKQPHQFSYCSCLHLSKTRAKLYTGFMVTVDSECQNSGAPQNPVPIQTKPTHSDCGPPLSKAKSGCEGVSRWPWRPCPGSLHARIWHSSAQPICAPRPAMAVPGSPPLALPRPQETRSKVGKTAQLPELKCSRKGVSETCCPPPAEEACVRPPAEGSRRRRGARGRGRAQGGGAMMSKL